MDCRMSGFPVLHDLREFAKTHVHGIGDAIQPSHPLGSPSPFAFNLPSIRVFSNESALHIRWPKYWSFSFISPSNKYSRLISFRIDWFDLFVKGTLKNLLQHHNSKTSILWHSAFLMVQLLHLHMPTGKAIALSIRTFVSKVTFLLFNMLPRFVIAFLPRKTMNTLVFPKVLAILLFVPRPEKIGNTVKRISTLSLWRDPHFRVWGYPTLEQVRCALAWNHHNGQTHNFKVSAYLYLSPFILAWQKLINSWKRLCSNTSMFQLPIRQVLLFEFNQKNFCLKDINKIHLLESCTEKKQPKQMYFGDLIVYSILLIIEYILN